MGQNINAIYDKYKHLDSALCDRAWLGETIISQILYDLWQAVRNEVDDYPRPDEDGAL